MAFPYFNRKVDWNLVLWQQMHRLAGTLRECVKDVLAEKHFAQVERCRRPFSVFGYAAGDRKYVEGWDGTEASGICGYERKGRMPATITFSYGQRGARADLSELLHRVCFFGSVFS